MSSRKSSASSTKSNTSDTIASKFLRFALNFCYFIMIIIGICLILAGLTYLFQFRYKYEFSSFSIRLFSLTLASAGLSALFVLFIGIQAGKKHSMILYSLYIIGNVLIFVTLLYMGVRGYTYTYGVNLNESLVDIKQNMAKVMKNYDEKEANGLETRKFDWLQQKFNCCGINDYTDWRIHFQHLNYSKELNDLFRTRDGVVLIDDLPDSCCIKMKKNCGKACKKNKIKTINENGCFNAYVAVYAKQFKALCIIAISACVVLMLAALNSLLIMTCFNKTVNKTNRKKTGNKRDDYVNISHKDADVNEL